MRTQFEKDSARRHKKKAKQERKALKWKAHELKERYKGWWCVVGFELSDHTPDWVWYKTQEQAQQVAAQAVNAHLKLQDDEDYETTLDGFYGVQCLAAENISLEEYSTFAEQDAERQSYIAVLKNPVITKRPQHRKN